MDGKVAMDNWRNSPSHYEIIMQPTVKYLGCYYNQNLMHHHAFCWFSGDNLKVDECWHIERENNEIKESVECKDHHTKQMYFKPTRN